MGLNAFPSETSLSLLTDFYELTMAYGYWKSGMGDAEAVFHLTFRNNPFGGGFTLAAGLGTALNYLESFRFDESDISYLRTLSGIDGNEIFPAKFLEHLKNLRLDCEIAAIPEGSVVFPNEPLVRVQGPLLQAQLLETALLNILGFQSLVATKAARICLAAEGAPVMEFGARRAQGPDGALSASRAAYIGGCDSTSNVLAGKIFGIPLRGTMAHSWVMAFDEEQTAFRTYADAMPDRCVFLVDTYDTLEGVRHAARESARLREHGHRPAGVRLDSGDLAYLSSEARKILDAAGLPETPIIASNELDEHILQSLKDQGARITSWGIGTKLATANGEPALTSVYKLSAIRGLDGKWKDKIKISEQLAKMSVPGILQIRRFRDNGLYAADAIYDIRHEFHGDTTIVDATDMTRWKRVTADKLFTDLLIPVFRAGQRVSPDPSLRDIRQHATEELTRLHPSVKRFLNPHRYPAGLEESLSEHRVQMAMAARRKFAGV